MNISHRDNKLPERNLPRNHQPFSATMVQGICLILDSVALLATGIISYLLIVGFSEANYEEYAFAILFLWFANFMLFHYGELYSFPTLKTPLRFLDKFLVAYGISFLMFLAIAFSLKVSSNYSRIWLYIFASGGIISIFVLRLSVSYFVRKLSEAGRFVRSVVIVGDAEQGRAMLRFIKNSGPEFLAVQGIFSPQKNPRINDDPSFPVIGGIDDLTRFVRANTVDDVIVALPWNAEKRVSQVVKHVRELPVNIYLSSDLAGFSMTFRSPPSHYSNLPMMEVVDKPISDWDILTKSIEDFIIAIIALVLLSPIMVLIAIAIKIESPGPVFFRQKRMGFNNREFSILKFRSMKNVAGEETSTVQATRNDMRVTGVGKFIRRTSLDELPQFFNVLNHTMSVVGPRPHALDHNEIYSAEIDGYFARHRVKPGITGWAQVNGLRGETKKLEKMKARVEHDIYYADNWSLLLDLKILLMTVYTVLFTRGETY